MVCDFTNFTGFSFVKILSKIDPICIQNKSQNYHEILQNTCTDGADSFSQIVSKVLIFKNHRVMPIP